jgi:hypothetical protein
MGKTMSGPDKEIYHTKMSAKPSIEVDRASEDIIPLKPFI